jgi:hypothetical protein
MANEVTSLAIQIYGGMGFIEEAGVAQHYRDARITAIYEGTNGIQAMDLVGRKLGLRGGEAVSDLLSMIAMLDPALAKAGDDLAGVRESLGEALTTLAQTTSWLMRHGMEDPRDALAGATPYLRMFSLVIAGWLMAKQGLAAHRMIEDGEDVDLAQAKLATAQFFGTQLLPQVQGLSAAVTAGHEPLMRLTSDQLVSS